MNKLLSETQVARKLKIGRTKLREYTEKGLIKAYAFESKKGSKTPYSYKYSPQDVEIFLHLRRATKIAEA